MFKSDKKYSRRNSQTLGLKETSAKMYNGRWHISLLPIVHEQCRYQYIITSNPSWSISQTNSTQITVAEFSKVHVLERHARNDDSHGKGNDAEGGGIHENVQH